ncbi:MAG: replication-relaxation family protein [Chloroflexi bacterium]|nr:replication-relaxation family protein [Chloroflexota bacterium]
MPESTRSSPLHLTPRDISSIETVYAYHGCAAQHLHDRFWSEESTPSATYRRVARLVSERYLAAHRLPSLSGRGSGKAFLTVALRGRRVLAERQGIPLGQLARQKYPGSSLFVHHHFGICDFRVALELATGASPDLALLSWTGEWVLKRTPMKVQDTRTEGGDPARSITLIPDGAFTLGYNGRTERGFLEMDMGTMAPKRLQVKLRGYLLQQKTVSVPIFFVTTAERRVAQVLKLAEREAGHIGADPSFIFVTTREQVRRDTILARPIWQQAGTAHTVAIVPGSAPAANSGTKPDHGAVTRTAPAPALATGDRA